MSLNFLPFGQIDVQGFLSSRKGEIRLDLIDAGMVRPVEAQYGFEEKADALLVTPRLRRGTAPVVAIPKTIPLTPWLVAFFGMYDGDGNKTNNIGFAQSEVHLQDFALAGEQALFGNQFETEVSILEDSKRFEGPEVIARMAEIRKLLIAGGAPEPLERILQEHFLFEEYSAMLAAHVSKPRIEDIRFTISPKKGATKSGGSSYEIIINLKKSKYFLPLFLSIVKEVLASIHHDQVNRNGIEWIAIHILNLCEVYSCYYRTDGQPQAQVAWEQAARILQICSPIDEGFTKLVARWKVVQGLYMLDAVAAATAEKYACPLLTTDHNHFDPIVAMGLITVEFLR